MQDNSIEYSFQVATEFKETSRGFHSRIQALIYFAQVDGPASLWDLTGTEAEEIKRK